MKKCLSLLLAALMLAAVLTGCGGNPSTEETDAPADTGTEQAAQTNWNVSSVTGTGTELLSNESVREAYLGKAK